MRAVYAVDVGSTRSSPPRFAWARTEPEAASAVPTCSDISALVRRLERDLRSGCSVALGFEAPLFIPVPENVNDLSRCRIGEENRAWSASAGSTVAMLGAHQAAWILRALYESGAGACRFTLDREEWPPTTPEPILFCWEAFVSGKAHGTSHEQDAVTAVMEFLEHEDDLAAANAVTASRPFSLIGAAALWSGWASSPGMLHEPALVIKPTKPYRGVE